MLAHSPSVVDDLSSAVGAGLRKLAKVNLNALANKATDKATSVAHSALPTIVAPPRRRRRWPLAGFLVVIGVAVIGYLYMSHLAPMIARRDPATAPDEDADLEQRPGAKLAAQ